VVVVDLEGGSFFSFSYVAEWIRTALCCVCGYLWEGCFSILKVFLFNFYLIFYFKLIFLGIFILF